MTKKKKVTTTTTVVEEIIDGSSSEKTQIICILDRSGSMSSGNVILEARNGFNNFLEEQKKLKDDATITVALFDDKYELLYDNVDIKKAEKLTEAIWYPRGMTALFDAIGKTINDAKDTHVKTGKRPDKVLVCIVTDGLENASQEYVGPVHDKARVIKRLIKECEKEDWNFIYLAANQNAFDVGTSFGVSGGNTLTFAATMDGAAFMSATLNNATTSYRSMSVSSAGYAKKSKSLIDDPNNPPQVDPNGNSGDPQNSLTWSTNTGCAFNVSNSVNGITFSNANQNITLTDNNTKCDKNNT